MVEYELIPGAAQILVQNHSQKDTYLSPSILPLLDAPVLITYVTKNYVYKYLANTQRVRLAALNCIYTL